MKKYFIFFEKLVNVFIFFSCSLFREKKYLKILFGKIFSKFFFKKSSKDYLAWVYLNSEELDSYCSNLDEKLWKESCEFAAFLNSYALKNVDNPLIEKMGGAGAIELLFFLVRKLKPKKILETGVALGYSSATFLEAIKRNNYGELYSSDFPYPGIKNSYKFIGTLVPKNMRDNWVLKTSGDANNLPELSNIIGQIDLIHYDSDKSYKGRNFMINVLNNNLHDNTIILFDDIHENSHFKDLVEKNFLKEHRIFRYKDKYIGMLGKIN